MSDTGVTKNLRVCSYFFFGFLMDFFEHKCVKPVDGHKIWGNEYLHGVLVVTWRVGVSIEKHL